MFSKLKNVRADLTVSQRKEAQGLGGEFSTEGRVN